jgi:hypothetical protein
VSRNGRLPTKLFTNEYQEKQKQRAKPIRQQKLTQEELEKSRTRPEEVMHEIRAHRIKIFLFRLKNLILNSVNKPSNKLCI